MHSKKKKKKKIERAMLYSNQLVSFNKKMLEWRTLNSTMANEFTNLNVNERITKFQNQLKNKVVYRIPYAILQTLEK